MFKHIRLYLCLIAVFMIAQPATAAEIGDNIPHKLEVPNQDGTLQSFDTLKGEKGAVLVFIRSADWCPFCQAQLIDLGNRASEIESLGYSLVIISYDDIEKLKAFSTKYGFGYTLLSDKGSEIIKAFDILNTDMDPASSYYGVPHPTIFVVNRHGVIRNKLAEEGYKKRPPVEAIIEAIKG